MPARNKLQINNYWLCQVSGWLGMVFIEVINYSFFIVRKFNIQILYSFLMSAVVGIALTHCYRLALRSRNVFQSSMSYIWIFALVSTVVLAISMTFLTDWLWSLLTWTPPEMPDLITLGGVTMNWARYMGVWIIIYFMYKILQQNNRIQKERSSFENLARTTELELLKSQLNPHFLFNALNIIKALVVIDPEQSRNAIVKLSELLRFTLQYGKERFIPLKAELQEVAKYLELEQLRFGERLTISIELPETVQNLSVPPAMVLTLAENAVKHGVARHIGDGYVHIRSARNADDTYTITITNPGHYEPGPHSGIGLKHVTKRLEELYHGRSILSIHDENGMVTASLKIPLS